MDPDGSKLPSLSVKHTKVAVRTSFQVLSISKIFQYLNVGIKPFYLYELPEHEAHLCPVRAIAAYIAASRITHGYLFRRMAAGDRPRQDNTPMVRHSL